MRVIVNLDSEGDDNTSGSDTALSAAWDGDAVTPLGESAYEYQTSQKVYDSLGSTHDITIYFDKAETDSAYEFIVTCNPDEDNRTLTAAAANHTGLLARGVITFNTGSGVVEDLTMERNDGDLTWTTLDPDTAGHTTEGYYTFLPSSSTGLRREPFNWTSGADMTVRVG